MAWHGPVPRAPRILPRALRQRLVRARARFAEAELDGVSVAVAESAAELAAAARLLHDAGVAAGHHPARPGGLWLTPHLLLPATVTFVARRAGRVVGTVSLFIDSVLGVPAEGLAARELARRRARRRRVAEAGALAVARGHRGFGVTYLLLKALYRCAVEQWGVDDLVVAVHPDDEDYYRAVLCFDRLRAPEPAADGGPVVLALDLRSARWTWFQSCGHLPPDAANPYHMFIRRADPQIALPPSVDVACHSRRGAVSDLLEAAPALLAGFSPRTRRALLALVGPGSSLPGERAWEPAGAWPGARAAFRDLRPSPR